MADCQNKQQEIKYITNIPDERQCKRGPSCILKLLFYLGEPASSDGGGQYFIAVKDRREEGLHISHPVSDIKCDIFMCIWPETRIHI